MDGWPPEPQRHHHKQRTSPPEMSQRSTPSPLPFSYPRRNPSDSSFLQHSALDASLDNPGNSFGRRRTVHPHNPPMHRIHRSHDTPERSRPNPPPRLEHRASQTLTIDLTDDNDEPQDEPPRSRELPRGSRNSGVNGSNFIDLTEDNDVEITRVAPRPLPSISDMALNIPRNQIPRMDRRPPFMPQAPARSINRVFPAHSPIPRGFHVTALGQGEIIFHPSPNFLDHIQMLEDATAIIGQMDRQIDLQRENGAAAAHARPDHIPPPDAKTGFTRSPTEKDIVICPSCEEELIQDKEPDEVAMKKSGKAPTRKEREEHPFWVVKSCGHVYCNRCYQNRLPSKQQPETVHFRDKGSGARGAKSTIPMCSVDECPSEVKNKDKWVGVFL